jgi:4-diphosphocytidyl-2-C-methyl-D-erythritol kinase
MTVYPNAKINIGLQVLEKLPDGYHSIRSVFYPIGLQDTLTLEPASGRQGLELRITGLDVPGDLSSNLCTKAYELIGRDYPLPGLNLHLHKTIPIGAGLGGGSSNAAYFIRALNETFELGLAWGEMHHYAKQLGSDCSFFISNRPAFASGKGDLLESMDLSLKGYFLVLVCPPVHVSTAEAYGGVRPELTEFDLESYVTGHPPEAWKDIVRNDFETSIFHKHPDLAAIKENLYSKGAVYASMTGSGSAVYGVFRSPVDLTSNFEGAFVWQGVLD